MYEKIINDKRLSLQALANTLYFDYNEISSIYFTRYTMVFYIMNKKFTIDLKPMLEYFKKDKTILGLQTYTLDTLEEKYNDYELSINELAFKAMEKFFKLLNEQLNCSHYFDESILDMFSKANNYIFALVKDNNGIIYECTYFIKENDLIVNKY